MPLECSQEQVNLKSRSTKRGVLRKWRCEPKRLLTCKQGRASSRCQCILHVCGNSLSLLRLRSQGLSWGRPARRLARRRLLHPKIIPNSPKISAVPSHEPLQPPKKPTAGASMDAVGEGRPEGLPECAIQPPKIISNTRKIGASSPQELPQPTKKPTAGASMDAVGEGRPEGLPEGAFYPPRSFQTAPK